MTKFSPELSLSLYHFYTRISSFTLALSKGVVLDSFYGLIFCSEKFSISIWRLPFAVNVTLIERLRFTFPPNGKREFVPRDQVFPLIVVYCFSLLHRNKWFHASFIHKKCCGQFVSAYFLFWEILNLNMPFAVCRLPFAVNLNLSNLSNKSSLIGRLATTERNALLLWPLKSSGKKTCLLRCLLYIFKFQTLYLAGILLFVNVWMCR